MSTSPNARAQHSPPMATAGVGPFPLSLWFGEAIRQLREERGGTQEALGYKQGGGRVLWENTENGKGNPTLRTIGRMAEALEIDWMTLCRAVEAQRVKLTAQDRAAASARSTPRRVRVGRPKSKKTPRR